MANLRINDIEALEILSLDELDRVVGGRGWKKRRARRRSRRSVCPGVITTLPAVGGEEIDLGIDDDGGIIIGG